MKIFIYPAAEGAPFSKTEGGLGGDVNSPKIALSAKLALFPLL